MLLIAAFCNVWSAHLNPTGRLMGHMHRHLGRFDCIETLGLCR
jgi:hypothetical protein